MLTPQQISALRDRAGQVTDPIVEYLIADIAERISEAGQITSTAAYQAWTAQKFGVSQKELKKELQKRLRLTSEEINQLFKLAAHTGYANDIQRLGEDGAVSFEENTALQQILDSSIKLADEDFHNITQTMGFVGPDGRFDELTTAYRKSCDFAFEKVVNGAQDYDSAVRDATRELARQGIQVLDYETGVHTSLEAAVRRNVMGGLGLMNEQITQQNHDDLGCDGWEISAHGGCAPDHESIQGKQYTDEEYTRLNNSLVRRIGTLNCGHSAMPIIVGVNEPQYTDAELEEFRKQNEEGVTYEGKHYTLYEATRRQRRLESSIRNRKHRILIDEKLGDKDKLQTDQIRLQVLKQEYNRFSKATALPTQHVRMEAAGFDWKKGKAAEKAGKQVMANPLAKAYSDGETKIKWPSKGVSLTAEQYKDLRKYAEDKCIVLQGFKNSDAAIDLAKDTIDEAERMLSLYPELRGSIKKPFTLNLDRHMKSIDFAEVREGATHIMHINVDAYRNRESLAQEYKKLSESGWFVRGTSYKSIVYHEVGHMAADVYGIDGLSVMKEVLGTDSTAEALLWCKNNLSEYSFKSDGSEIISEMFSAYYGSETPGKEVVDFMSRCDKIIVDWRGVK